MAGLSGSRVEFSRKTAWTHALQFSLFPLVLILPTAEEVSFCPSGHAGWQAGN